MPYDPLDADSDPFRPPAIPTLVGCLHCGQEYESYRIEWRVFTEKDGSEHGFWCCPIEGCDGKGFGFDILPVDPEYQDERGGWVYDDEDLDSDSLADEIDPESSLALNGNGRPGRSDIFHAALQTILREIFDGPPDSECYLLNPGDPGLLRQLDSIDAAAASTRPMPGQTTIAAHVDHVLYGLSLLNRWADGEPNPWAAADWNASWQHGQVTDPEWESLRSRLREAAARWQAAVARIRDWNHLTACGALASAAHTAYHLGAIRQILAALQKS